MINEIRKKCSESFGDDCKKKGFYLVRFNGSKGILRCKNTEKENAIILLKSITEVKSNKIDIDTVGTSGTIKSLIKKHFDKY